MAASGAIAARGGDWRSEGRAYTGEAKQGLRGRLRSGDDKGDDDRAPLAARDARRSDARGSGRGADAHVAIVVGLAGDPEHAELFQRWAATMVDGGDQDGRRPRTTSIYLAEKPEADPKRVDRQVDQGGSRQGVRRAGHGRPGRPRVRDPDRSRHVRRQGAKFNLPGPDMTPADFAPLLAKLKSKHVVLVNTSSASGPFVDALAAPGRTIVAATRNGAERFATLFGGYFVDGARRAPRPTPTRTAASRCSKRSTSPSARSAWPTSVRGSC